MNDTTIEAVKIAVKDAMTDAGHQRLLEIIFTVEVLERTFLILLALAIGEAIKQFIGDPAKKEIHIQWWRLPSLLAFLLLIIPFSHGMVMYLHDAYCSAPLVNYGGYLLEDVVAFTTEAILFFVLSRRLDIEFITSFYVSIIILLGVDSVWGFLVSYHRPDISNWLRLNFGAFIIFCLLVTSYQVFFNNKHGAKCVAIVGVNLMLIRTALDYYLNWSFYFPPVNP